MAGILLSEAEKTFILHGVRVSFVILVLSSLWWLINTYIHVPAKIYLKR